MARNFTLIACGSCESSKGGLFGDADAVPENREGGLKCIDRNTVILA